jgi:SAM-dependent methyltransferase
MDLREVPAGHLARHPWELARAACLLRLIEMSSEMSDIARIGDVGAGDLFFARRLRERTPAEVLAVDPGDAAPVERDGIRLHRNLAAIPDASLDLACLLDVLEHERDDRRLVAETVEKLRPEGRLLVTAPAYGFLFSAHDVRLKHLRRYGRAQLHELLRGLEVDSTQSFHFFTSLFLVRCAQVLLARLRLYGGAGGIGGWRLPETHPTTRCLVAVLRTDFTLNRWLASRGLRLPGLSICLTARKKPVS